MKGQIVLGSGPFMLFWSCKGANKPVEMTFGEHSPETRVPEWLEQLYAILPSQPQASELCQGEWSVARICCNQLCSADIMLPRDLYKPAQCKSSLGPEYERHKSGLNHLCFPFPSSCAEHRNVDEGGY